MVLEAPIPKTAGGRPPTFGGPPVGTTFSGEPDDRDSVLVTLKDNVQRLVRQAEASDKQSAASYLRLLEQRREWIKRELEMEELFTAAPRAPLGIQENRYDLASLTIGPDHALLTYQRMLDSIDRTMAELWERILSSDEVAE